MKRIKYICCNNLEVSIQTFKEMKYSQKRELSSHLLVLGELRQISQQFELVSSSCVLKIVS